MARRSLLKMYNKMLDNMEGVQSTSSGHGLGPLHHATVKIPSVDNPDDINKCISDMGVTNKRYDSDTTLCQRSDNRRSISQQPLVSDAQPYVQPKFHLRRKEELPSATPHWSSSKGLELKESVSIHLDDNISRSENYIKEGSAASKRGKSSRIRASPKPELGPYTPPQFFFSPQKYIEASKKDDVLISVENRVPPSLQSWAKKKTKQEHSNREMETFKDVELENDTYYNPVREPKRKESATRYENKRSNINAQSFDDYYKQLDQPQKTMKPNNPVSCPEIVKSTKMKSKEPKPVITPPKIRPGAYNGNRINEETNYWGNLRRYKKLYEKTRWKETHANYASQTYGNDSWKTTINNNPTSDKKTPNDEANKFVYGNDNWRKTLNQPPQEKPKNKPKIKEPPPVNKKTTYGNESWRSLTNNNVKAQAEEPQAPEPISAKIVQQIKDDKYDKSWEIMSTNENNEIVKGYYRDKMLNLNIHQEDEVKQTNNESNIWNDIEPFLPSFLSTSSNAKDLGNNKSTPIPITIEAPKKQDMKEKVLLKSEASTNLLEEFEPKPVPKPLKRFSIRQELGRPSRAPLSPIKNKEQESISLFKHFQARSKLLRKQHSLLEKKKANYGKAVKVNRQLSAVKGCNYYNTKPYVDESEIKAKKKETSYAPGTVCDIDDDGFKLSQSTEAFAILQGEKYGSFENMFGGYQTLFNR